MDKLIKEAVNKELNRQRNNIELIASENFVSPSIMKLQGSVLTNKYAEGYSGKRYYGGCENIDIIEDLANKYLQDLFKVKYTNVQPHSGSSANMAVYKALLNNGDKVLGMNLDHGGHLTHGHSLSFSGSEYNIIGYTLNEDEVIDYEKLKDLAIKEKPKMIIAGASAYSREIDFKKFKEIADLVDAYLLVDMAHIAGLVATGLHMSPVPYADIITSTTHKTLRGPRGGIIMTNNEDIIKKINRMVFPGIQGGPLMHVIAAKAQCFYEALKPDFKIYQEQVIKNAKIFSEEFIKNNYHVVSNGTDNHMFLVDIYSKLNISGLDAETILDKINITTNKNMIPNDKLSARQTSGLRLGTPAMTSRGFKEEDFKQLATIIITALENKENKKELENLKSKIKALTSKYPLYENNEELQ